MKEFNQFKEKKKGKKLRSIVKPLIIIAIIMEEIHKMHIKSGKNWMDFLKVAENGRETETFDQESYEVSNETMNWNKKPQNWDK